MKQLLKYYRLLVFGRLYVDFIVNLDITNIINQSCVFSKYATVAVPLTAQRTKPTFQNLVRIRVIDLKKRDFYPFSAS